MNSIKGQIILFLFVIGSSCNQPEKKELFKNSEILTEPLKKEPLRFGMVTGIKPEKIAYYKELHANTWEGVLEKIRESNIENYSIYIQKIEDKYFLFSYYEYVGDNYEVDMNRIAADSTTQRWWQETDPCQIPLPEAAAKNQIWTTMEEVFYTD